MTDYMPPARYALLVGIDLYLNTQSRTHDDGRSCFISSLAGCVNDVHTLQTFLRGESQFTNLSVLTSSPSRPPDHNAQPVEPIEQLPTFHNIEREFGIVHERAGPGDLFFFHYSGHGARLKRVKSSPHGRSDDPSLITVDYGCGKPAIRGWQLNAWLERLHEKGIQVVVVLDSCYSGGSWRDDCRFRTQDLTTVSNLHIDEVSAERFLLEPISRDAVLERSWLINPDRFTVMTACDTDEKAAEIRVNGKRYGAFTHELLEYLNQCKAQQSYVTYRTIRDQLKNRIQGQTPRVFGRDRLLFFGSTEPFSATPLVAQIAGDIVTVPAGRVHGVHLNSEFAPFPPAPETEFSITEVGDFECNARISPQMAQALQTSRCEVFPTRWCFGKETVRVVVDPSFGQNFQGRLHECLQSRIASPIEIIEHIGNHELDTNPLRLEKRGENVEILGPESLVGYAGPVRGLQYLKSNDEQLASKAAVVLAHLSRFKHVRGLRAEASHKPPPFKVIWDPNDHAQGVPFPNGQHFRFTFESKSNVDLYLTVMDFGPGFLIEQLYPQQDSAKKVTSGSTQSFPFKVEVPIKLKSGCLVGKDVTHRDIIRTLVTQGKELSWKSLELPAIWNADQLQLGGGKSYERDVTLPKSFPSDFEWWVQDIEIWTMSSPA